MLNIALAKHISFKEHFGEKGLQHHVLVILHVATRDC